MFFKNFQICIYHSPFVMCAKIVLSLF
jgi:hypothetical protein